MKGIITIHTCFWLLVSSLTISLLGCAGAPTKQADEPEKTAMIYVQLGYGYIEKNKYDTARRKLTKALELAPQLPEPHDALAYLFSEIGEAEKAEEHYQRAISKAPDRADLRNNFGAFLCKNKRYREAEEQFLTALSDPLYQNQASVYENAGICALKNNQPNAAEGYFQKSLVRSPTRPLALVELAQLRFEAKNFSSALVLTETYLQRHRPNPRVLMLGAKIAGELNQTEKQQEYITLLKEEFPKSKEWQSLDKSHDKRT